MGKSIVTGAAGFIGSNLVNALLERGEIVIGVDHFNDYYDPHLKQKNISKFIDHPNFTLIAENIINIAWSEVLTDVDVIYHQAAQAGVRASWGKSFSFYTERNITATQVLLEAAKNQTNLQRFVYASSSSIYGNAETFPTPENICPQPVSPYGITKLVGEQLCNLYHQNFAVPTTCLRYFTVYGPHQRPDMAFHKFFQLILNRQPIPIYGDGQQTRDFTFISDAIAANLLAGSVPAAVGEIFNIGGGSRVVLTEIIDTIENIVGQPVKRDYLEKAMGDARHTSADVTKAKTILGYQPLVALAEGLEREWQWIRHLYDHD